jgi:hypothetical protein
LDPQQSLVIATTRGFACSLENAWLIRVAEVSALRRAADSWWLRVAALASFMEFSLVDDLPFDWHR